MISLTAVSFIKLATDYSGLQDLHSGKIKNFYKMPSLFDYSYV